VARWKSRRNRVEQGFAEQGGARELDPTRPALASHSIKELIIMKWTKKDDDRIREMAAKGSLICGLLWQ
jgi:hypothetical protein